VSLGGGAGLAVPLGGGGAGSPFVMFIGPGGMPVAWGGGGRPVMFMPGFGGGMPAEGAGGAPEGRAGFP
jgi:hypothetical protein